MNGTDPASTGLANTPAHDRTIAAIDIGSNSIKMTVARARPNGAIDEIDWRSEVVRLGAGLDRTGRLADDRIDAAVAVLHRFARAARGMGAAEIVAVATEATRTAANGAEFLDRARNEAGIDILVIDGEREAELAFQGLKSRLDLTGEVLVADIGGGSTELIFARNGDMLRSGSVAVGSGRLTDLLVEADPPTAAELAACHQRARDQLEPLHGGLELPGEALVSLILVGGTGEYLGRMVPEPAAISLIDVERVRDRMQQETAASLASILSIPEARARVLPAGIAIVTALVALTDPAAITIGQSGLRSGLLLEAFASEHSDQSGV